MKFSSFISPFLPLLILACTSCGEADLSQLTTPFEQGDGNQTATYDEAISWWRSLEGSSPYVKMIPVGNTDAGIPLHVVLISKDANFNLEHMKERNVPLILINNGIHPGEPDGVDASMLLARDLLSKEASALDNCILAIVPMFNIGGALNRNCCSRANQDGPESYGFRGNARNLDLNRDFIKLNSLNAQSLVQLVTRLDPDVYLETHVSNGADYPYTLTYLLSHPEKQTPPLGQFTREQLEVPLVEAMKAMDDEIIPYVNVFGTTPDSGYSMFYDSPRYSTGFMTLHQTISLLTETHMLKPFDQRVESTLRFMQVLCDRVASIGTDLLSARQEARQFISAQDHFVLSHRIDRDTSESLYFKGYRAYYDSSVVTGSPQLFYDRSATWEGDIPYYTALKPVASVESPVAYLVPAAWREVVERLAMNGVEMDLIDRDTVVKVSRYRLLDYNTVENPYEGHYLHSNTSVVAEDAEVSLIQGSYYLASTAQRGKRVLIETLEPQATDAYFNWNFFDEILQQKEWFSSYVFEPEAEEMLKDPDHRAALDAFIATNPQYRDNAFAKLYFLYKRTDHFEADRFMVYPVYRIHGS